MAPIRPKQGSKPSLGKVTSKSFAKSSSKSSSKPSSKPSSKSSSKSDSKPTKFVSPASKAKPKRTSGPVKKKKRMYTEKELGIPTLNMITPAGVQKVRGKKKGKVFVDDQESMMTILAIVNAEKEGQIESKMIKARHMEEIREARRKETEAKQDFRKSKLEETKDSLRRPRHKKTEEPKTEEKPKVFKSRKRVSFA